MTTRAVRCHYDVLQVARDADEKSIKKAHRKLALKYHPDKTQGCDEAAQEFLLVQQAYECLSDAADRKWYDEHRESILRGGKGFGSGNNGGDDDDDEDYESAFLFNVTPFHFSGCYKGYNDDESGFFQIYQSVFQQIINGETNGWINEGNIDETKMCNAHLPTDFGKQSTPWTTVSQFYNAWESFTSCLAFAHADKYDVRQADSRWERRRMEEENRKARKMAKKERNEDIVQFVAFVKKRDPRVKAAREKAIKDKERKDLWRKEEEQRKKVEAAAARERWKLQREKELQEVEINDLNAGRIRLADLSDDDEYYRGGRKKKGKKGKRNRIRNRQKVVETKSSEKDTQNVNDNDANDSVNNIQGEGEGSDDCQEEINNVENLENRSNCGDNDSNSSHSNSHSHHSISVDELMETMLYDDIEYEESSSEEESESEPEPEIFKCICCRKTFKSEKQLENHLKSKKHKETFKKWQKKQQGG